MDNEVKAGLQHVQYSKILQTFTENELLANSLTRLICFSPLVPCTGPVCHPNPSGRIHKRHTAPGKHVCMHVL